MDENEKACPVCGEIIKKVALKCRFCNSDLVAFAAAREMETEKILFAGHPAVIYNAWQILNLLGTVGAAIFVANYVHTRDGVLYAFLGLVAWCGIALVWYYLISLQWRYTITSQRFKREWGIFSTTQESLELFRIDHFELEKPLSMRVLGHARLRLFTSDAELEKFSVYGVPNLEGLAETLRECQLRERARRGLTTFVKA